MPWKPAKGHLKGHYPAYTMLTCQRKNILLIYSLHQVGYVFSHPSVCWMGGLLDGWLVCQQDYR